MPQTISQQTFSYDALSNITTCVTTLANGDKNTATYSYERSSGKDPCQLQSVTNDHADYPKQIKLTYDACGRLKADEHSRTLTYDACGRLASIAAGASLPVASYQYDAFDRLVEQTIGADTTSLYYRASALVNQLTGTDTSQHQRFIGGGIAQSTNETSPKTWLTGSDSQRNVLLAEQGETRETQTYSPYGDSPRDTKAHSKLGYTGERRDPASGVYHLGNGYRSYNPVLMRFTAPDSWSPFGAGGINPYAYCNGDPINRSDPSGHHSFLGWMGIGVGVALGVLFTPVSGGSSLAAALSVISVVTGVVSIGLAVAQQFVEESDPKTAAALAWAALGTGIVSSLSSAALSRVAPGAKSLAGLLKGTRNRPFGGLMMEGGSTKTGSAMSENQIQQFIEDNLDHTVDGPRIYSQDKAFPNQNYFQGWYTDNRIILEQLYRRVKTVPYRTSQVVKYQFNRMGTGIPNELVIDNVDRSILNTVSGLSGAELTQAFDQKTPFGPMTKYIMDDLGVERVNNVRREGENFIISLRPKEGAHIPENSNLSQDADNLFTSWDPSQGFI